MHQVNDIDPEVLRRFVAGDQVAFTSLFYRFHQRLYFFARRFVEAADAEDVVSEAFAQLWQRRENFAQHSNLSQFLFVAVRNKCISLIRHQLVRRDKQAEMRHLLERTEEHDLHREELLTELVSVIYRHLDKLSPRMREIFLMSFREGLSPSAIAQRLGLSVQTVKNKKLAAIKLLQEVLGPDAGLLALYLLVATTSPVSMPA